MAVDGTGDGIGVAEGDGLFFEGVPELATSLGGDGREAVAHGGVDVDGFLFEEAGVLEVGDEGGDLVDGKPVGVVEVGGGEVVHGALAVELAGEVDFRRGEAQVRRARRVDDALGAGPAAGVFAQFGVGTQARPLVAGVEALV